MEISVKDGVDAFRKLSTRVQSVIQQLKSTTSDVSCSQQRSNSLHINPFSDDLSSSELSENDCLLSEIRKVENHRSPKTCALSRKNALLSPKTSVLYNAVTRNYFESRHCNASDAPSTTFLRNCVIFGGIFNFGSEFSSKVMCDRTASRKQVCNLTSGETDKFRFTSGSAATKEFESDMQFLSTCKNKTSTPKSVKIPTMKRHDPLAQLSEERQWSTDQQDCQNILNADFFSHQIQRLIGKVQPFPEVATKMENIEYPCFPGIRSFRKRSPILLQHSPSVRRNLLLSFPLPIATSSATNSSNCSENSNSTLKPKYLFRDEHDEAVYYLITKYLDNTEMTW